MVDETRISPDTFEDTATLLKALADPNRLRIMDALMQGASCNCELNGLLGLPPNLLSHHLRILRQANLITSRRDTVDSRWIYYSVNREMVSHWQNWFNHFFDTDRFNNERQLCGPEGQEAALTTPPTTCRS
jgi:ArsR family transcriptional regulator